MQLTVSAAQVFRLCLIVFLSKEVVVDGASQQRPVKGKAVSGVKAGESNLRSRAVVAIARGKSGLKTSQLARKTQAKVQSRPADGAKPNQHLRAALVTKPAVTAAGPAAALHVTSIPPPVVGGPTAFTKRTPKPLCVEGHGTSASYTLCHAYPTISSYCCMAGSYCYFYAPLSVSVCVPPHPSPA